MRYKCEINFFLFLDQNICCEYSKESSKWDGSFEHPNQMFKLMGKKIFTILRWNILVYLDQWNLSVYTYGKLNIWDWMYRKLKKKEEKNNTYN